MELVLEENRAFKGNLFLTTDRELKIKKMKGNTLSEKYNKTKESNIKKRRKILEELLNNVGENVTLISPIYFHYGSHTTIGNYFFSHFNLVIQDDVWLCSNVKILLGVKLVKEVLLLKIYLAIL